ncbi:hypothetical protein E2562_001819 [Oryza meyeriana var. granulata]|uniref:Retroviral polymerase SH3-like domain-containing protein n=1 Tax=Oryza meyeriana var. granulata TaxID=110450 RepID=A0A6G1CEI4_9ORYZ|nr:hypothetical protein E2562_001819 [Oryza meyeriana var. granulata]
MLTEGGGRYTPPPRRGARRVGGDDQASGSVVAAVYVLNRSPTKSLDGVMPYEAWHGRRPMVEHLRVFGCVGHVKTARPNLRKLDDRGTRMVFIGYEDGTKAYQMYDPVARRVYVSHNVVFDETAFWNWGNHGGDQEDNEDTYMEFSVENFTAPIHDGGTTDQATA